VACLGKNKNAGRVLMGKPEVKRPTGKHRLVIGLLNRNGLEKSRMG
jgi:hypothetical protein